MKPKAAASLNRRFARDARGATAVEFSILALPFILAMLAVLEFGYVYLVNASLDNATAIAARQIRTGQLQTSAAGPTSKQQQFKNAVCSAMSWVSSCQSTLQVSAETESSWSNQSYTPPVKNGTLQSTLPFNMGTDGCIVLIHSYYPWKIITPYLWRGAPHLNNNGVLLSAATLIINEPYSSGSGTAPAPSGC